VMDLGEVQTWRAACGAKTGSSVCTSERLLASFRTFLSSPSSAAAERNVSRGTASHSRARRADNPRARNSRFADPPERRDARGTFRTTIRTMGVALELED
jgi:hypothetical protein